MAKLKSFHPELFSASTDAKLRDGWIGLFADQLENGDCRAAVVIDADQGIVATYTDELDCVVMLKFKPEVSSAHQWKNGTRLLTVNTYQPIKQGVAMDLKPGPNHTGDFGNVRPLIADLVTDQLDAVAQRKRDIDEDEWSRALSMGQQAYAEKSAVPRDGRPLRCDKPIQPAGGGTNTGNHSTGGNRSPKQNARPRASFNVSAFLVILVLTAVSFAAAWIGFGHVATMEHDGLFWVASGAVLFFVLVGLRFLVRLLQMLRGL